MIKINIRRSIIVVVVISVGFLIKTRVDQREGGTAAGGKSIADKAQSLSPLSAATAVTPGHPLSSDSKGGVPDPGLTPALAKSRIEEYFSKTTDLLERSKFARQLFIQLCENGFSKEAFQLLDQNYGSVRSSEIITLFAFAEIPNSDLLEQVAQVSSFDGDKEKALWGYLARFKASDLAETVSDPEFKRVFPDEAQVSYQLGEQLRQIAAKAGGITASGPEYLMAAKELIDKGYLTPFDFMHFTAKDQSSDDAFERWNQIQQVIPNGSLTDTSGRVMGNPGQTLIAQMVIKDGPKALGNLLKREDYRSVKYAISQWTLNDPSGAAQWYGSNMNKLGPRQNDAVSEAFASTALSSAEFDGARAWAERTRDPVAKKNLMDLIAEKENKLLADRAAQEESQKSGAGK